MDIEGGRAESAPTLDNIESFVQGWYEDLNDEIEKQAETQEEITEKSGAPPVERDLANEPLELERRNGNGRKQRNVSFSRKVQLAPYLWKAGAERPRLAVAGPPRRVVGRRGRPSVQMPPSINLLNALGAPSELQALQSEAVSYTHLTLPTTAYV